MRKRTILFHSALLAAFALSAPFQPAFAQIRDLPKAGTIRVTETCSLVVNSTHTLSPCVRMEIAYSWPDRYRVGMTYLLPGLSAPKPSLLVSNGVSVGEYVALNNQYLLRPVKADPMFRLSEALSVDTLGELNLLTQGFQSLLTPATPAVIDGRNALLSDARKTPGSGKNAMAMGQRLWRDVKTGLPLRYERYSVREGQESIIERIDYSDWAIDTPIPDSTYVWNTPPGATAYHPTDLLPVGTSAPDFSAVTPDGKTVRLSDYKNKIVVLDFWATWCHPCQEAMPHLETLYRQQKDRDVVFLALCVMDQRAAYDKWIVAKKSIYSFPTAFDMAGTGEASIAVSKYGVKGIPAQFVIDRNGRVAFAGTGYQEGDHRLEDTLTRLNNTSRD